MRVLLDTHTFIWLDSQSSSIGLNARSMIADPNNTLLLSLASVWEMQIKVSLGKLTLGLSLADIVHEQQQKNGIQILPIEAVHIYALDTLPHLHRDPFDRLLIAQAQVENISLLSGDADIAKYPIKIIW
jgi:PIN domain nuclease of toxin-antitoxin system